MRKKTVFEDLLWFRIFVYLIYIDRGLVGCKTVCSGVLSAREMHRRGRKDTVRLKNIGPVPATYVMIETISRTINHDDNTMKNITATAGLQIRIKQEGL